MWSDMLHLNDLSEGIDERVFFVVVVVEFCDVHSDLLQFDPLLVLSFLCFPCLKAPSDSLDVDKKYWWNYSTIYCTYPNQYYTVRLDLFNLESKAELKIVIYHCQSFLEARCFLLRTV